MNAYSNLLIVRTPFQAWICLKLVDQCRLDSYDLMYITHDDSEEDRRYFERLSARASNFDYIYVKPVCFDVFTHIKLRLRVKRWFNRRSYKGIYVGSIDALVINSLICKFSGAKVYTFDDGLANLVKDGSYHVDIGGRRLSMYRWMLGASPVSSIKERIVQHYSIYKGFCNIVDSSKVTYLNGWSKVEGLGSLAASDMDVKRYFIGAPFDEVMSIDEIKRMIELIRNVKIDGYVMHPREKVALSIGADVVEKKGRIAEEFIIEDSKGFSFELYGHLSSVMINLQDFAERRIVFLPREKFIGAIGVLAKEAGCEVVVLNEG
ncbi:unnamed protein product [Ectocarpus sp. 12 AP-2014]